jgi:plasmid maintenance system antidote protein VapI
MRDGIFMAEGRLWNQVGELLMSRNEPLTELADSMGFTVSYIYDIIHGRRKVSAAVIEAIRRLK